jgi:hypothetical protein
VLVRPLLYFSLTRTDFLLPPTETTSTRETDLSAPAPSVTVITSLAADERAGGGVEVDGRARTGGPRVGDSYRGPCLRSS